MIQKRGLPTGLKEAEKPQSDDKDLAGELFSNVNPVPRFEGESAKDVAEEPEFLWFGGEDWEKDQEKPKFTSRVVGTYKEVAPKINQSLEDADSPYAVMAHIRRLDGELFKNEWDGEVINKAGLYYDDSPLENEKYRYIRESFFDPALSKLIKLSQKMPKEDKGEIVNTMGEYVRNNYRYYPFYFDRAADLTTGMLEIAGIEALPVVVDVSRGFAGNISEDDGWDFLPSELEFGDPEHRGYHRAIVEAVADYPWGDREEKVGAAKHLSEHIGMGSIGNLRTYVDAFERLGVNNSVPFLLENLEKENQLARRMSAEVLFRLELGKRSVEEGELEVFGKVFKLVSERGQRHVVESLQSARRLDPHGRWAVFDENARAKGIFTVSEDDLSLENEGVVEKSIDLELGNLFREACIRRVDETPKERSAREKIFKGYLNHFDQVIDSMHERTGVWLNSLDIHEQAFFVHVYRRFTAEGSEERVENIIKKYGEEALKVFVTMEYGESGDSIIDFLSSEDISESTKKAVLEGYYELSYRAGTWRDVFDRAEITTHHYFASEVYEAFIRKSSEYFRAAMIIERGEGKDVKMQELLDSLSTMAYSMNVLEGLYKDDGSLSLEGDPQTQAECKDSECNVLIEDARTTWILFDQNTGDRVVVSIRPQQTVKVGNRPGGEARINFKVSNKEKGIEARIGLDLSDYGDYIGEENKPAVVSLDLGTGVLNRSEGIYLSQRVGRVLSLVGSSEGGHNEASFSKESARYFRDISYSLTNYLENRFTQ